MADGKRLNLDLSFNADTSGAKQAIKELQDELSRLSQVGMKNASSSFSFDKDLLKASQAASQLRSNLQSAFNVKTGNIDMVKFNQSMKQAGMSAQKYRESLQALGSEGTEAFAKLSQAIATSDAPLTRANSKLNEFATALKNTARWQISSSVLHGFMSTLSQAFSYAQNLNESLNNIQIVTGQSSAQMAQFAETANKAAQSLSTTTRAYTDAALIFYQQGLGDSAVKERTDAVIKMANVTKDSASDVSSYMTAIWNNFDDGTKSLEHYADVITALGASTASSSAEIASGLEKFASIGKTIGLSYDYATSALATIVANTRQSAETVGNGLRTIFARLQGLSLGETLDDGVNLTKYSKALQTVGVSVLDASGNMRDMDSILNDLAGKWDNLSSAQQTALAQTVGGVRQYTTLISLMNNWGDMNKNLNTAQTADGSLQSQADIYAQSWEAAQKRVQASAEAIYSSLINDEFFINLNNGFAGFLNQIENVIEGLGGLKGLLSTLTPIITALFRDQINSGLNNTIASIKALTPSGRKSLDAEKQSFAEETKKMLYEQDTPSSKAMASSYNGMATLQQSYIANVNKMGEAEKAVAKELLNKQAILKDQVAASGKIADNAEREQTAASKKANDKIKGLGLNDQDTKELKNAKLNLIMGAEAQGFQNAAVASLSKITLKPDMDVEDAKKKLQSFINVVNKSASDGAIVFTKDFDTAFKQLETTVGGSTATVEQLNKAIDELIAKQEAAGEAGQAEQDFTDLAQIAGMSKEDAESSGSELFNASEAKGEAMFELAESVSAAQGGTKALTEDMEKLGKVKLDFASGLTASISALTAVSSLINSINGLMNVWGDSSKSVGEKILTTITTIIPVVASLTAAFGGQNGELLTQMGIKAMDGIANLAHAGTIIADTDAIEANTAAQEENAEVAKVGKIQRLKNAAALLLEALGFTSAGIAGETGGEAAAAGGVAAQAGWWPLVALMLIIVAVIGAVVGVCALVAAGVNALTEAYNADAIAAEKAAATAKALADAYTEAKDKYDEMVATMDKYKSARAALDSLTEGTEEYNAALAEANELGLQLINSTSGLKRGTDYKWENGQLIISDEAMARVKQQESEKVAQARAASLTGNAYAAQMKAKSDQTDFIRSDNASVWGGIGGGAAAGAAMGAVAGPVGALVGGLVGAITGGLTSVLGNAADDAIEAYNIDALTESYRQLGAEAFSAENLEALGFDSANQSYIESLKKVVEATVNAEEQMHNAARMAAQEILSTNESYQRLSSQDKDRMAAASGRIYEMAQQSSVNGFQSQLEGRSRALGFLWDSGASDEAKAAWEKYASMQGISSLNGYKLKDQGKDSVKYEYIDENGERQTREVTTQQIAAELAAAEAAEQLGASTQYLMDEFNRLENSTSKADKALSDFLAGDIKDSSRSEFQSMRDTLGDNASTTAINKYLGASFGDGDGILTDEEAKKYGYETAAKMAEAFQEQYNSAMRAWDSIDLPEGMGDWSENLSLGAAQQLENIVSDLNLGPMGEKAGSTFVEGLNKMLEGVDAEDQANVLNALTTIDWSSWDAMAQAEAILKEYGVDLNLDSEYWKNFTEQMRIAARAVPDFSKLKSDLNSISKIVGSLKFGDAVKEEDYQTLIAYKSGWEHLFVMQADGSRKFIGNADDMAQATKDLALSHKELLETYSAAANNDTVAAFFNNKNNDGTDKDSIANFQTLLAENGDVLNPVLKALGYDEESIANALADPQKFKAMFDAIREATDTSYLSQIDQEFEEMYASTAKTATELGEMLAEGTIGQETYQKSLILMAGSYGSCTEALNAYRAALESGTPEEQEAARVALEAAVDFERLADSSEKAYSAAMKGRSSLSEENLKFLKENNPELWSMYFTASDEEWASASREIYRNWLDERMSMYAEDTVEYRMAYQERKQLDEDYYDELLSTATAVYDAQIKKREEVASAASSVMSSISSSLGSTEGMSFSEIEDLRDNLIAAGVSAERVEEILNNINSADRGSAEQIKAQMVAATEAALGQLGANSATRDEYAIFTNLKNGPELTQEISTAVDNADTNVDGSISYVTNIETGVKQEISGVKYENGTITYTVNGEEVQATVNGLKYNNDGSITFKTVDGSEVTTKIESIKYQDGKITYTTVDGSQVSETIQSYTIQDDGSITFKTVDGSLITDTIQSYTIQDDGSITFKTVYGASIVGQINSYKIQDDGSITFKTVDGTQITSTIESYKIQSDGTIIFKTADGSQIKSTIDSYKIQSDGSITFTTVNGDQITSQITSYTVQTDGSITFTTADGSSLTDQINGIKFQSDGSVTFATVNGGDSVTASVESSIASANRTVSVVAGDGTKFTATVTGFVTNADGTVAVSMTDETGAELTSKITGAVATADGHLLVSMADGSTIVSDATDAVGQAIGYMGVSVKGTTGTTVQQELSKLSFNVTATVKLKTNQAQAAIEELNRRLVSRLSDAELRQYTSVASMSIEDMMAQVNQAKSNDGWWSWLTGNDGKISWDNTDKATMSGLISNIMTMDDSEIQQLITNGTLPQIVQALQAAIDNGDTETAAMAQSLMDGLKLGIENASVDWDAAVASTGVAVIAAFKNSLGIHSPSALTKALAPYLFEGLSEGIAIGATGWKCPSEVQGLGAIIATAFSDSLENAFSGTQEEFEDQLGTFSDNYLLNKSYLEDKNLTGAQGVIMDKAVEAVIKNNGWGSLENALAEHKDEFYTALQEEFNSEYSTVQSNVKQTWASIKDIWKQGLSEIYAEETETAQKVCDLWEKTFKAIAKARQGLADGKSIMESMYDDPEAMASLVQSWMDQGMSYDEAMAKLKDPNATVDYEAWDAKAYRKSGAQRFLNYEDGKYQATTTEEMRANATQYFTESGTENVLGAVKEVFTPERLAQMSTATDAETVALVEELINQGVLTKGENGTLALASDEALMSDGVISSVIKAIVDDVMAPYSTQSDVNGLLATAGVQQERQAQRMSAQAQSEGEDYIERQQKKLDIVDKAREAMLNGKDLSTELTAEEQASLLEITGASDLTAVSLNDLDTATTTLSSTMVLAAEQIAVAMGMLQRGKATGFSIDEKTGAVTVTRTKNNEATITAAGNAAYEQYLTNAGYTKNAEDGSWGKMEAGVGDDATETWVKAGTEVLQAAEDARTVAENGSRAETETVTLGGEKAANVGSTLTNATTAEIDARNAALEQYAESVDMTREEFEEYAQVLKDSNILTDEAFDETGKLKTEYARFAQNLAKMERGFKTAQTNGDSLLKTLQNTRKNTADGVKAAAKNTADWVKAAKPLRNMYDDILGLGDAAQNLSDDFLLDAENMKLAQKAAEGDEEAMNKLQVAFAKDLIPTDKWTDELQALADEIAAWDPKDLEVGATINATDFLSKCTELINKAGVTAEQASAMLSTMGVDAEIVAHQVWVPDQNNAADWEGQVPYTVYDKWGLPVIGYENVSAEVQEEHPGHMQTWYTIEGAKYNGKGVTHGGSSNQTGGGGGGGGGRERRSLARSHAKPERYHRINERIDDLAKSYEKLNKEQERAWGPNKIRLMQQEADLLKKQADTIKEKINETKKWAAVDKKAAMDVGWTFDENGVVSNYEQRWAELQESYNQGIAWYNGLSAAEQEAQDKIWAETEDGEGGFYGSYEGYLKKLYLEKPQEILQQWEETRDQLEELGIEFDDQMNQLHDNLIAQIQAKLDTTLKVTETEMSVLDYKLKRIQDDAYKTADSIAYFGSKIDISKTKLDAYKESVNDLLKAYNANWDVDKLLSGELTLDELVSAGMEAGDIEIITNAISGIISCMEELDEAMSETYEAMDKAFSSFNDDLDRYVATIDHAATMTQTYRNILDLTGRTMSGLTTTMIKSLNEMTVAQAQSKLEASKTKLSTVKTEYDVAYDAYLQAQEEYEAGRLSAAALQAAKETYQNAQDNVNSAQEEFVSSWEAALQAAADAFQNTMEAVVRDIGDSMVNGLAGGLAEFENQFAKLKEQDEDYVDDYEKIYQLTKLSNEVGNKIDNSSNVRAQKELLKFQQEIHDLLESDQELSKYDIDYMRKKYDLKVAELALEEAQNAKSSVSMRRDAEGNYNYVYTADDDAVAKAEDEYATKLYEMQKANDEYITNISDQMASLQSQMLSEISAIDTTIYDTEEKYQAEVSRITEHYQTQMEYYSSEMDKVLSNNKTLYENDWVEFNKATGYKISAQQNYVTQFNQTALAQASGFETLEEYYEAFGNAIHGGDPDNPTSNSLIGQILTAYATMKQQMQAANDTATDGDGTTLADFILGNITELTSEASQAADAMRQSGEEIKTAIEAIGDAAQQTADRYSNMMTTMGSSTDQLLDKLAEFISLYGSVDGISIDQGILTWIQQRKAENPAATPGATPAGYDTGGYTGNWGDSSGRLAVLHAKELVLNAQDTSNMLSAIELIRQISSAIDLNALASAGAFTSLLATQASGLTQQLQQEVHIEANFPNATDKNQIEEAFMDVINLASQYANRG